MDLSGYPGKSLHGQMSSHNRLAYPPHQQQAVPHGVLQSGDRPEMVSEGGFHEREGRNASNRGSHTVDAHGHLGNAVPSHTKPNPTESALTHVLALDELSTGEQRFGRHNAVDRLIDRMRVSNAAGTDAAMTPSLSMAAGEKTGVLNGLVDGRTRAR